MSHFMAKKREIGSQKVRIKLRAYDHRIVDESVKRILELLIRYNVPFSGPTPLPTEIKRFTILRQPAQHKDAREQFEIRVHKRLIEIKELTPRIVELLQSISLPSSVDVEIKT